MTTAFSGRRTPMPRLTPTMQGWLPTLAAARQTMARCSSQRRSTGAMGAAEGLGPGEDEDGRW